MVISGVPLYTTSNVDLPAGSAPTGAAAQWYIFAVSSAGLTSFNLDVNTSAGESTGRRLIGSFYWDGSQILPGSIASISEQALALPPVPFNVNGRLTLQTATPYTTADIAATTLYFTPYHGNRVPLYALGADWSIYSLTEISVSLASLGSGKVNDVFLYYNGATLALNLVEWTNTTTRAVALTLKDGMLVKSGYPNYLYLGTIAASAAGKCDDTKLCRYVWNNFNRRARQLALSDTTDNWSYSGGWRMARGVASNCVSYVAGLVEDPVYMNVSGAGGAQAVMAAVGIGVDVSNATSCQISAWLPNPASPWLASPLTGSYLGFPGIGVHTLNFIEYAVASVQFYGDNGINSGPAAGLNGYIMA